MYSRFVFLLVSLFIAIAPAFAYDWNHEAAQTFDGNLVERRASIQGMSINCFYREACDENFASGTLRDFFAPFESQLQVSDSNAALFSYDELFLLYAVSAQFYRDKSAAWEGLVQLMENADAIRDSLSHRNNPFAGDSAFAETFALHVNYQEVEDGFSELDVSRELKEAFRVVLEAVVVRYSRSRLVEMEKNSHDGSKYGVSYQFLEKARDRFFSRYPQSRYTGLILGYIPEAYAQESLARMMSEKKWFMFSILRLVAYSRKRVSTSSKRRVLRGETVTFKKPSAIRMERRSTTSSPSSTTFTHPFGNGITFETRASTPTLYRSSIGFFSSSSDTSLWATRTISLLWFSAYSRAWSDISRPTRMRRVVCGKTTASLKGSRGNFFEKSIAIHRKDSILEIFQVGISFFI